MPRRLVRQTPRVMRTSDHSVLGHLMRPLGGAGDEAVTRSSVEAVATQPELAADFLRRHRIGALWLDAARRYGLAAQVPESLRRSIEAGATGTLAYHLVQEVGLKRAVGALEEAAVPLVVMKGAYLGRVLYPNPGLRPAGDVDVLVAPGDRGRAIRALEAAGFVPESRPDISSHEVPLRGHRIELDLHWQLFRPGRARFDLGAEVLASRRRYEGLWVPSDLWTLVILLVHPALTEHVTARLGRAVDLDRWVRTQPCPWEDLLEVLGRSGLRTAAWSMLAWTRRWLDTPFPPRVERSLRPGAARRRYLEAWLDRDPGSVYEARPTLVRAGFSLALEDSPWDVARSLMALGADVVRRRRS